MKWIFGGGVLQVWWWWRKEGEQWRWSFLTAHKPSYTTPSPRTLKVMFCSLAWSYTGWLLIIWHEQTPNSLYSAIKTNKNSNSRKKFMHKPRKFETVAVKFMPENWLPDYWYWLYCAVCTFHQLHSLFCLVTSGWCGRCGHSAWGWQDRIHLRWDTPTGYGREPRPYVYNLQVCVPLP